MSIINFRRFAQPNILMEIAPSRLLSFLHPFRAYFAHRGLSLPEENPGTINYAKLSAILMDPDDQVPSLMVDALYFINEMANPQVVDALILEAKRVRPDMVFDSDASAADIVVQIWLQDPEFLEKQQAASLINKPKSFEYHISRHPQPRVFAMPNQKTIQTIEHSMNDWFEKNRRGRSCRIIIADHGDKISFLVRHGKPIRRESNIKNDGESISFCYRPEIYDVIVYDRLRDELGIRASGTKGEKMLYRETIGLYLFGDRDYFPGQYKFTLKPLEQDGVAALVCSDIPGMDKVILKGFLQQLGGRHDKWELHTAEDIFLALEEYNESIPPASDLRQAVFSIKFSKTKKPRSVTIRPPNRAMFHRDEDGILIDQWLIKRGFVPRVLAES